MTASCTRSCSCFCRFCTCSAVNGVCCCPPKVVLDAEVADALQTTLHVVCLCLAAVGRLLPMPRALPRSCMASTYEDTVSYVCKELYVCCSSRIARPRPAALGAVVATTSVMHARPLTECPQLQLNNHVSTSCIAAILTGYNQRTACRWGFVIMGQISTGCSALILGKQWWVLWTSKNFFKCRYKYRT